MTTAAESRQFIQTLRGCGASEEGAKFVRMAIDPFHDVNMDIVGMPDDVSSRSIVYDVRKSISISAPTGLTSGAEWDCHVAFIPFATTHDYHSYEVGDGPGSSSKCKLTDRYQADSTQPGSATVPAGILVVDKCAGGDDTFSFDVADVHEYQSLSASEFFQDRDMYARMIGGAFEVQNTTESLHKSGALTMYYQDSEEALPTRFQVHANSGTWKSNADVAVKRSPPTNLGDAKLLNGVTIRAEEGCLVPLRMNVRRNPPSLPRTGHIGLSGVNVGNDEYMWVSEELDRSEPNHSASIGAQAPIDSMAQFRDLGFQQSGAYFTGMSAETKLELTVRIFVEAFPLAGDPLVALAKSSPPLDSTALQCYSEIMEAQLAGYPVSMNSAGGFFRSLAKVAKRVAQGMAPVLQALPDPRAKAVGAALETGMRSASDIENAVKASRKKGKAARNKRS